jgi:hypothetical protein
MDGRPGVTAPPSSPAGAALRVASQILFLGYVLLLIAAGAWGVVGARIDFPVLLGMPVDRLTPAEAAANVLSQYRFLRAMELGFGLFAWRFRREIFTQRGYNRLFLAVMAAGVAARLVSMVVDGMPSAPMLVFLAWELLGVVVIFVYTRTVLAEGARAGHAPDSPGRPPDSSEPDSRTAG